MSANADCTTRRAEPGRPRQSPHGRLGTGSLLRNGMVLVAGDIILMTALSRERNWYDRADLEPMGSSTPRPGLTRRLAPNGMVVVEGILC